ncbi:ABC transporter permease [Microbacterium sp. NIBRBAC000506063]|uniref:ABC transporter permease n=1 Tax=Microbacterium sp. NIBRBAC000506063 TaxID=2734618 RepID=UPI001BB4B362|nr:ABC transporter permease [Microbacterium sp. NIBRBAC000506063]QTV80135.1 ABC transporter permease [Microbacterium sp. NIBRBAC000506063]
MAFAGVVAVMVYKSTGNMLLALLGAIAIGVLCNLVNAFMVATLRTPAFIVTLGMMLIARGAVLELTQGQNILQLGDFILIGQGNLGWLPIPVLILIIVTIVVWYLMNQTRYGRAVYAVGGNEEAARAAGIAVERVKYQAFLVNGVLVGIAGAIFMSRVNAGLPNAGIGYELQAITAPIIGGTSFSGGVGTVMGTLAGALIVGVLGNIMNLIGIGSYIQQIVMGSIIVVAVAYDVFSKRGKAKTTILKSDAKGATIAAGGRASSPPQEARNPQLDRTNLTTIPATPKTHEESTMKTLTRRIIALGAAAVTAISLAGCAVTTGNPTTGATAASPKRRMSTASRTSRVRRPTPSPRGSRTR